jgi:hypothetical protein
VNAWDEIEGRLMQAFCGRTLCEVADETLVELCNNCRIDVRKLSSLIDWLNEQTRCSGSRDRGSNALRYRAHDLLANTKCIATRPGCNAGRIQPWITVELENVTVHVERTCQVPRGGDIVPPVLNKHFPHTYAKNQPYP